LRESIESLLPLVDEYVIGVGRSEDQTLRLVRSIRSPKLKVFETVWDMGRREGGLVLSQQTNLALERCSGDWAVYLQADEALHEDDLPRLRRAMLEASADVDGLTFDYLHFYGSYQTVQDQRRKWYRRAVRAVRRGRGIVSVGDAYGFKAEGGRSLRKAASGARVFHYGWTRPPGVMLEKQRNLDRLYHDDAWVAARNPALSEKARQFYEDRGQLAYFRGSHPRAMRQLVAAQGWRFEHQIERQWPDWLRRAYVWLLYPLQKTLRRWRAA
jgi:glycosyltransferase involved in cell wall biosynthesis